MRRRVAAVLLSGALAWMAGPPAAALQGAAGGVRQDRIVFGELPAAAAPAGGFMWVLDRWGGAIAKIDPATNEVVDEIDLEEVAGVRSAWDLDAFGGSLWTTASQGRKFLELDPATGELRSIVRTRRHVSTIHPARGSLWFTTETERRTTLVRMDPRSGKVARFPLGKTNTHADDVVAFDGSVWVARTHARYVGGSGRNPTFYVKASLWRIDPQKNRVVGKLPLGSTYTRGPVNPVIGDVEAGDNGLWMSRVHERRLTLVRPRDGRVLDVEVVAEFEHPWEFEVLDGELWVGELNRSRVVRIDPETGDRWVADVAADTSFLRAAFGSVWAPVVHGAEPRGEIVRLTAEP